MKNVKNTSIIKVTFLLVFQLGLNSVSAQNQPDPEYKGVIAKTLAESKEYWPEPVKAPKGAPNVIWILLDDVGFGASSAFGGLVNTPTFDDLANNGLRFTNFHTVGVCAPTRAALLTGRNHHTAHMGLFPHKFMRAGFPGYDAKIPSSKGTVAEVLRENGYSTYAVGKWHLTPDEETTDLGPFDRWPSGKGFDHFYGFLGGATDQYKPDLVEDNKAVKPDGRHLNTQLADKAISYLQYQQKTAPAKPFFLYLTPGATHSPHQVDQEWIDKYKGKFDKGWDWYRETVFANQKKLGVIPQDAKLPKRNERVKEWEKLSAEEKRINARFFESYAGFFEQTDYEIGRIVSYLKKSNQFDNTIIFLVIGDNGASKEGSYNGSVNNEFGGNTATNEAEQIAELSKNFDKIGTKDAYTNYPAGWAQAANTPFKFWKADAHAEGGTRNPLIVSYPNGIKNNTGIRTQYGHVIDLLPTTLALTGINKLPESIRGIKQDSLQGKNLTSAIQDVNAPSVHQTQYYFLFGEGAIYNDGWKASFAYRPDFIDLFTDFNTKNKPVANNAGKEVWELYNVDKDFNEINDLAKKNPEKLKELVQLFDQQAKENNVYPLINWSDVQDKFKTFLKQNRPQQPQPNDTSKN
ncbi:arylsulfatase [Flavobacterium pectinovorum]|uniref:arylsulfatase n=1 Tax=Flavobacterium pectinovorum TaxID=29533 RepID=UPI001FAD1963|nr:arylsulfatase [Flavobacterium pectinovorum]MCI9846689.1 arylsulfatase [Flavobacterium pectinovorum]